MCTATRAPNLLWIAHRVTSIFSIGRCPPSSRRRDRLFPPGSDAAFNAPNPIERLGAFLFAVAYTSSFQSLSAVLPSKQTAAPEVHAGAA